MRQRQLETFSNEETLLRRIDQLKAEGISERDIHVISKHKLEGSALDYTDVQYRNAEGTFGDKVAAFFTGEDPQSRVYDKLDLTDSEKVEYENAIESGQILLYVDNDAYHHSTERQEGSTLNAKATPDYNKEDDHTGLDFAASTNAESDADYSGKHRDNNLKNREEVVDMNNFNNEEYNKLSREERLNLVDEDIRNRDDLGEDEKIQLHEERLRVNKDTVQSGEVTIDKNVVEERQEFDVPVSHDEVTIERRDVKDRAVADDHFDNNLEDETIRVPLTEERVNIEKDNVVSEELVIKKNRVTETEHVSENVRKEEVDIDDSNAHLKDRDHNNDDLTDRRL
ncbi:DUF2382 domain-containing protein [Macrococcus psychrotolerans]|uniref:DUF2382 domain-containing protein n=1 Tax=Macrococcus psychrotolerans TaxID=3039389 RepID=A0AAT9P4I1_9STAP|nr:MULTISPECIES: DUF2382 domain-containing protein [Macrococcus]QYA32860.1 DUF2382 domain-containing protein [Macrococcus sp. 19Msa1099]QYA37672.1 DUF2382 domain-containing protein [Macrococcus caseolyticus]QYA76379.1 DUF2382 domain-containing protein [Macrococcus caseolyticus]